MDSDSEALWRRWKVKKSTKTQKTKDNNNVSLFVNWWWIFKQLIIEDVAVLITKIVIIKYVDLSKTYRVDGLGEYLHYFIDGLEKYGKVKRKVWDRESTKPDKFNGVLKYFSTTKDPLNSGEWRLLMKVGSSEIHGECICSQKLSVRFFYFNEINKKIIVVGSECIKKFGNADHKASVKLIQNIAGQSVTDKKIPCAHCGVLSITKYSYSIFCNICTRKGIKIPSKMMIELLGYKKCKMCPNDIFSTSKKDLCKTCCIQHKKTEENHNSNLIEESKEIIKENYNLNSPKGSSDRALPDLEFGMQNNISLDEPLNIKTLPIEEPKNSLRKCSSCANDLPPDTPKWKQDCLECYIFKKTGERKTIVQQDRQCINCKEINIPAAAPKWKKRCLNCYTK